MNSLEINRSNYGDRENDKHGSEKITSPVNRHSNSRMNTRGIRHTARNDFGLTAFPFLLPIVLLAASNEIFRNPQRTYFSANGGNTWFGADQPLVDQDGMMWAFASAPGVAIDTRGTIFFSQLLIASVGNNFRGDAMVVNRTTDN